jgi:hypothetical protein
MRRLSPLLVIPFLLQSCCAGHSVTLNNTSGEDKLVTIQSRRYATHPYSFTLPKGKNLVVDRGLGFPDMDQLVIVNNTDTIRMTGDDRTKIKARRIDYFFTVTIDVRAATETAKK